MPGLAKPIAPYMHLNANRGRGQKRGILRVDGRTRAGRLLKAVRAALLAHVGADVTIVQKSLIERIAWLELRCVLLDQKQIEGQFSDYDAKTYLAEVGALRRCYSALGIHRPTPRFAELLKK